MNQDIISIAKEELQKIMEGDFSQSPSSDNHQVKFIIDEEVLTSILDKEFHREDPNFKLDKDVLISIYEKYKEQLFPGIINQNIVNEYENLEKDVGSLDNYIPPIQLVKKPKSQVYQATHRENGRRLPYMDRSFISFSYGGVFIEDFNLIATISNNFLHRDLYANFTDNTTNSNILDGQKHWSTHYDSNHLELVLATDGITETYLEQFKRWFIPGVERELILSEHPNRAIMARVAATPSYDMIPFEEEIYLKVAATKVKTSTTMYKGSITINFVMDEPFWYSKINLLDGTEDDNGNYKANQWIGKDGKHNYIFDDQDAIKIIHEDGIPFAAMFSENYLQNTPDNILFGMNKVLKPDLTWASTGSRVGNIIEEPEDITVEVPEDDISREDGARAGYGHVAYYYIEESTGFSVNPQQPLYFYYPGTAPSKPLISFDIELQFNDYYIITPANSITSPDKPYNEIFINEGKSDEKVFKFTTPSILTAYNQVIKLIDIMCKQNSSYTWEEFEKAIRQGVCHELPRKLAMNMIKELHLNGAINFTDTQLEGLKQVYYRHMFWHDHPKYTGNATCHFEFNSYTGQAQVKVFNLGSWFGFVKESALRELESSEDYKLTDYNLLPIQYMTIDNEFYYYYYQLNVKANITFPTNQDGYCGFHGVYSGGNYEGDSTGSEPRCQLIYRSEDDTYHIWFMHYGYSWNLCSADFFLADVEENAGDCVRSSYLIIDGKDYISEDGYIESKKCHTITTNCNLSNFKMEYNYMYL